MIVPYFKYFDPLLDMTKTAISMQYIFIVKMPPAGWAGGVSRSLLAVFNRQHV